MDENNIVSLLFKMPNIIFTVGGIIAVVSIVGEYLRKSHQVSQETALKRDLIAQGRSADEIERILQASSRGKRPKA
jgi:hypothetical protein